MILNDGGLSVKMFQTEVYSFIILQKMCRLAEYQHVDIKYIKIHVDRRKVIIKRLCMCVFLHPGYHSLE